MQGIEGVEKFLLRSFLAGEELDVVDEQDVARFPVAGAERQGCFRPDGADQLVHETLGRSVDDSGAGTFSRDPVADGDEEVRLSEADPAVDEQRVVRDAGVLCDGLGGGVCELVAGSDDERIERVAARKAVKLGDKSRRRRDGRFGPDQLAVLARAEDKSDVGVRVAGDLLEFGADLLGVPAFEPLTVEGVGDFEIDAFGIRASETQGLEPRVERVVRNFRAELRERPPPRSFQIL